MEPVAPCRCLCGAAASFYMPNQVQPCQSPNTTILASNPVSPADSLRLSISTHSNSQNSSEPATSSCSETLVSRQSENLCAECGVRRGERGNGWGEPLAAAKCSSDGSGAHATRRAQDAKRWPPPSELHVERREEAHGESAASRADRAVLPVYPTRSKAQGAIMDVHCLVVVGPLRAALILLQHRTRRPPHFPPLSLHILLRVGPSFGASVLV
jgi:hypothetical protein